MSDQSQRATPVSRIKKEVVILGGGFAGVFCGQRLAKELKKSGFRPEDAAIVSNQNYMVFQPMLAEVAGASIAPRHVISPIRQLCKGLSVYRGIVEHIDLEKKEVHVDTGHYSADVIIEFNHVVLALGAEIDLSRVPGMPEHAFLMQNVGDAMVLRSTIISRIEEANAEHRPHIKRRLLTFVVVGGGYSGVETAGEILDMLKEAVDFYRGVSADDYKVILVHSRDRILQTLTEDLGHYAGAKLADRGLELRLKERVRAVTATKVYLNSGDEIETATVVSTVGNAPNSAIRSLCSRESVPHERNWISGEATLQVKGLENVWAAGDCASIPYLAGEEGDHCPQTAQFAMRQGILLAQNIGRSLRGEALKPFTFKNLGELASIGHHTAVASIMGMQFSGFIAWFMWRTIYLSKLPRLDRKLRVVLDWTLDLFFPRDINLLNPSYTEVLQEVHLEPDDILFNSGEPAFSLYVVKSGQIDLVDKESRVVRSIEPGDFFGERALVHGGGYLYNAVARGATELVALAGDVVLPFFHTSRRFKRVLAKTTAQSSAEAEVDAIVGKLDSELLEKPVDEVMRTDLAVLKKTDTLACALTMFQKRRFSSYPLVDGEGKLNGVLSREDFFDYLKKDEAKLESSLEGISLMHLPVCFDSVSVSEALECMVRSGRYKCLVTNSDQKLVGIVAVLDLLGQQAEKALAAQASPDRSEV